MLHIVLNVARLIWMSGVYLLMFNNDEKRH